MNAYTYLIGWSCQNKFYYGAQWNKNADPSALWKTYFTSSKWVAKFRAEFGDPDVVEVRKEFGFDAMACRAWEERVLNRIRKIVPGVWLNRASGNRKWFLQTGWQHSDSTKSKISKTKAGRPGKSHSPETRAKISASKTGVRREFSKEHRERLSVAGKTRVFSEEHRKKLASAGTGMVNAINIATGERVRVSSSEFASRPELVGMTSRLGKIHMTTLSHGFQ
jgi:hypothetical protein